MMLLGIELFEADRCTVCTTWRRACGRIRVFHDRTAWRELSNRWSARVETSTFAIEVVDSSEHSLEAAIEEKLELIKRQAADLLRGKKAMEP